MYLQEKSESCGLFSTAMIYPSLIGGQGAQPRAICTYFKSESPSKSYLLCRTAALLPSRSLDNDIWRPTNSSSPVTMFGLTRGLAMSFRASIVWAGTSQRHQGPVLAFTVITDGRALSSQGPAFCCALRSTPVYVQSI